MINQIPVELWQEIAKNLPIRKLYKFRAVSKAVKSTIDGYLHTNAFVATISFTDFSSKELAKFREINSIIRDAVDAYINGLVFVATAQFTKDGVSQPPLILKPGFPVDTLLKLWQMNVYIPQSR